MDPPNEAPVIVAVTKAFHETGHTFSIHYLTPSYVLPNLPLTPSFDGLFCSTIALLTLSALCQFPFLRPHVF